jgi:hypothetical protein
MWNKPASGTSMLNNELWVSNENFQQENVFCSIMVFSVLTHLNARKLSSTTIPLLAEELTASIDI